MVARLVLFVLFVVGGGGGVVVAVVAVAVDGTVVVFVSVLWVASFLRCDGVGLEVAVHLIAIEQIICPVVPNGFVEYH